MNAVDEWVIRPMVISATAGAALALVAIVVLAFCSRRDG